MDMITASASDNFVCYEDPVACKQALSKRYWLSRFTPRTLLSPEPTHLTVAEGNGGARGTLAMDTRLTVGPPSSLADTKPSTAPAREPTLRVCFQSLFTMKVHGRVRSKINNDPAPAGLDNERQVPDKLKIVIRWRGAKSKAGLWLGRGPTPATRPTPA